MNRWRAENCWVIYEIYNERSLEVLVRDWDTWDYVMLLRGNPVTEGSGPVWRCHMEGDPVGLRVLDQGLAEGEARRACEALAEREVVPGTLGRWTMESRVSGLLALVSGTASAAQRWVGGAGLPA